MDPIELIFRSIVQDDGGLARTDAAIKQIAKSSGLTGRALDVVEQDVRDAFTKMSAAGLNFEQIVKRLGSDRTNFGALSEGIKQVQRDLKDAADAAANLDKQKKAISQAGSGVQNAIANPFSAVKAGALEAASALGPVGLVIAAVGTAATLGAKALFDFVDSQGRAAQATVNMAAQIGISAGEMKKLQVEGDLIGVSFSTMQMAARQLAVALEEPTGAGKRAAQTLADLGIAAHDASGGVRAEGAVFQDVIETLSGVTDHTKQVEEATRLFGSRGSASLLLLIQRYHELDQTARELGYGDTTKLQAELAKGEEKINALSAAWDLFKAKLAQTIAPIIIPAIVSLTDGSWNPFHTKGGGLSQQIADDEKYEQKQKTDAQNTINKTIASSYQSSLPVVDGMEEQLKTLKQQLATNESILANPAGMKGEDVTKAKDEALGLRNQIDALAESLKRAKERASEIVKLRDDQQYPDLQSPVEFRRLIAQRQKEIGIVGQGNASLVDASPQFGTEKIQDAINKFFLKIGEDTRKAAEQTLKDAEAHGGPFAEQNIAFQKSLKERVAISESDYSSSQEQLKIINDAQRSAVEREQQRAIRMAELQGGPGGEGAAIQLGYQARVSSATTLRNDQLPDIQSQIAQLEAQQTKTIDDIKQINSLRTDSLRVVETYEKEIADARMDAELKIAELRKKELDEYKQQAGSLFDALRQPGGRGLQQWYRGQANDLARGVFSNATAPILQGVGQTLGGFGASLPGPFQSLFKGTVLDSAHAKTPQIVATDANTTAINANTSALIGKSVGGSFVSPAPGSIAATVEAQSTGAQSSVSSVGPDGLPLFSNHQAPLVGPGSSSSASNPNQFLAGLTGFLSAKGGIGGGGLFAGLNPDAGMTGQFRAGNIISSAGAVGAGVFNTVQQFQKGGEAGVLGGVSSLTGTAAMLDPEPISKAILGITSLFAGLFKGLLPDPVTAREAQIANQTQYNTYVPPPTLNRSLSSTGGFEQVNDKYGMPSATSFTSVAIESPYKYQSPIKDPSGLYQNWETAPGQVIEPYQTPAAQPSWMTNQAPAGMTFIQNISALDTQSFLDAGPKIATSLQAQVVAGHPVANALTRAILGS